MHFPGGLQPAKSGAFLCPCPTAREKGGARDKTRGEYIPAHVAQLLCRRNYFHYKIDFAFEVATTCNVLG